MYRIRPMWDNTGIMARTSPPGGFHSAEHHLSQLRVYVVECLRRLDKDPYYCELCKKWFTHKMQIHHKKYDGATIYDLCYACRKCQLKPENVGLQ